jgi:hypothetical protein
MLIGSSLSKALSERDYAVVTAQVRSDKEN